MLTYSWNDIGSESRYEYLYQCIKNDITNKKLMAGEKLPSKRSFAKNMQVSVITIENAYAQLLMEGYIYSVEKKGYFVSDLEKKLDVPKVNKIMNRTVSENENYFMDFVSNTISHDKFPFSIWAKLLREVVTSKNSETILTATPMSGILELREAIARHLYEFRGMSVNPNQIIIGAGTEYLYHIIIQLLGRNRIYAVEDPGYTKITDIYESNDVNTKHIAMDRAGIKIEELEKSKADIIHISPSHHFPTGIVMPVSRRLELLDWASKSDSRYIIEDDYDCEFRHYGKPIQTLQSMDDMKKIIYMNTFSKSLAPSFRISYMVLPEPIIQIFHKKLGFYSCTVSNFDQYTLAEFITRGYLEKHINRMRKYYKEKRDIILNLLNNSKLNSCIKISEEDSGLHFLVEIDTKKSDKEIMKAAKKEGIRLACLSNYYYKQENRIEHVFLINYSGIDCDRLEEAINRLEKILLYE